MFLALTFTMHTHGFKFLETNAVKLPKEALKKLSTIYFIARALLYCTFLKFMAAKILTE